MTATSPQPWKEFMWVVDCATYLSENVKISDCLFFTWFVAKKFRIFFKLENPTSVLTPTTIDATDTQQCFYLRNDISKEHADSCTAENNKWLWIRVRKIAKSCRTLRIRGHHLWSSPMKNSSINNCHKKLALVETNARYLAQHLSTSTEVGLNI